MQLIIKGDGKGFELRLSITWRSASALILAMVALVTLATTNIYKIIALLGG